MRGVVEDRFEFGNNWKKFLELVDEKRISAAENSLKTTLRIESMQGLKILDMGSGSGLFSLAAHRLGAEVVSIDYDADSVLCTNKLKEKYAPNCASWSVLQGSALDVEQMNSLGKFDGVYSWGVLHHTGDMVNAIELTSQRVKENGWLFIAIYNDQGGASQRWLKAKKLYHKLPNSLRRAYVFCIAAWHESQYAIKRLFKGQNPLPMLTEAQKNRGMTLWVDWVDWVGGLPFEVATPEKIINPLRKNGFMLDFLITEGKGWGCNEFIFHLDSAKKY